MENGKAKEDRKKSTETSTDWEESWVGMKV